MKIRLEVYRMPLHSCNHLPRKFTCQGVINNECFSISDPFFSQGSVRHLINYSLLFFNLPPQKIVALVLLFVVYFLSSPKRCACCCTKATTDLPPITGGFTGMMIFPDQWIFVHALSTLFPSRTH